MEKELIINNEKYILASEQSPIQKGIMNHNDTIMLIKIEYNDDVETINVQLKKQKLYFKLSDSDKASISLDKKNLITEHGTKINYEYYEIANKLIKLMIGDKDSKQIALGIYESINEETKKPQIYNPILLVNSDYGVLIAPKVDC